MNTAEEFMAEAIRRCLNPTAGFLASRAGYMGNRGTPERVKRNIGRGMVGNRLRKIKRMDIVVPGNPDLEFNG